MNTTRRSGMGGLLTWLVILVIGLASVVGFSWKPLLGLDLQGGLSVTLKPKAGTHPTTEAIEQAKQVIRERVDGLGVAEPDVVRSGSTVVVQLPGLKDPARALEIIGTTAKLEFRPVLNVQNPVTPQASIPGSTVPGATTVPGSTVPGATTLPGATTVVPAPSSTTPAPASTAVPTTSPASTGGANQSSLGELQSGVGHVQPVSFSQGAPATTAPPATAAPASTVAPGTQPSTTPPATTAAPTQVPVTTPGAPSSTSPTITASDKEGRIYTLGPMHSDANPSAVGFDGTALSSASAALSSGQWLVSVTVKDSQKGLANRAFNACYQATPTCPQLGTSSDTGRPSGLIAMVLDGQVLSAPTVGGLDLPSNPFQITGQFTHSEASDLALKLRYGSLPVEFEKASVDKVSATLGASSLHAGLVAGAVGLALVALYMLLMYRMLGAVALASLVTSAGMLWIIISWLGSHRGLALTLSGITGIIVSIGVAVDSNIVYYEHLREDMDRGRSFRGTALASFTVAWKTILSADFVSLIGAAILYFFTVGSVRGFAFYLGLATFLDLLATWFFMRPVVFLMARSKWFAAHPRWLGLRPRGAPATSDSGALEGAGA